MCGPFAIGEKMKYIIMCGGNYPKWDSPRQLIEIHGEPIVARTIRLLKTCGVKDISISTNDKEFNDLGVPILKHKNEHITYGYNDGVGNWCDCFYPTDEPTTYIFGDVVFSPEAIRTIVDYETDSIMLFGSKAPFSKQYPKWYIEPFAFKVADTDLLKWAIKEVKRLDRAGAFHRRPIAWELWNVIKGGDPNQINPHYMAINDYTCDIDKPNEAYQVEAKIPKEASIMAEKKTTPKKTATRKPKAKKLNVDLATYKGRTFEVLERNDNRVKLTDGMIHFWVRATDLDGE